MIRHHFLDSLSCVLSSLIRPQIQLLDIGTGAGFPGIPLKIYLPDIHITAVDSVSKKILFLRHLCRSLHLQDVECLASRIEDLAVSSSSFPQAHKNDGISKRVLEKSFEVIVSRAVGTISYLLGLAKPFLASGGHVLLQRGHNGKQEIADQVVLFREAGFQVIDMIEVCFSFFHHPRYLILFRQRD